MEGMEPRKVPKSYPTIVPYRGERYWLTGWCEHVEPSAGHVSECHEASRNRFPGTIHRGQYTWCSCFVSSGPKHAQAEPSAPIDDNSDVSSTACPNIEYRPSRLVGKLHAFLYYVFPTIPGEISSTQLKQPGVRMQWEWRVGATGRRLHSACNLSFSSVMASCFDCAGTEEKDQISGLFPTGRFDSGFAVRLQQGNKVQCTVQNPGSIRLAQPGEFRACLCFTPTSAVMQVVGQTSPTGSRRELRSRTSAIQRRRRWRPFPTCTILHATLQLAATDPRQAGALALSSPSCQSLFA
eukprot:scaffold990_cov279-Pinguiococcus_pyrenoidosus.AAC.10